MVQTLIVYGVVLLATARIVWSFGLRNWLKRRRARTQSPDCGPNCNCSG